MRSLFINGLNIKFKSIYYMSALNHLRYKLQFANFLIQAMIQKCVRWSYNLLTFWFCQR